MKISKRVVFCPRNPRPRPTALNTWKSIPFVTLGDEENSGDDPSVQSSFVPLLGRRLLPRLGATYVSFIYVQDVISAYFTFPHRHFVEFGLQEARLKPMFSKIFLVYLKYIIQCRARHLSHKDNDCITSIRDSSFSKGF